MAQDDDRNPLLEPSARVKIPFPAEDPRALATAQVADPENLDPEDRRRMANLKRRVLQRRARRARYLDHIYEVDRALYDELCALRSLSPQGFRKRLQHEARRLGIHTFRAHGPRGHPEEETAPPEASPRRKKR